MLTGQLLYNEADGFIKRLVSKCPTLHAAYKPAFWYANPWINVLIMMVKNWWQPRLQMKRETIICPDGGEVSLDWADDSMTRMLPPDAPVVGILHTITGGSRQNAGLMRYAAFRGWRSCVLNRRGHSGMRLRVIPHFSIMGNVDDTVLMVDKIKEKHPDSFIGLAGFSAGSGQVVSYIGREGNSAKINAAASLCPAWDLKSAFSNLQTLNPWLDKYITKSVIHHFLDKADNQEVLSQMSDVVKRARSTNSLNDFMDAAAPLAGCSDMDHFMLENNPMEFFDGNTTPCLVLNALDDFLCLKENIRTDVKDEVHNYVLKVTERGSHVAYNEGMFAQGNFMWRITLDFFETIKSETASSSFQGGSMTGKAVD